MGEILRSSPALKEQGIFQEYPVSRVNPSYRDNSHKFDWVILNLRVVIECHGIQHYSVQTFGMSTEDAIDSFRAQQRRDKSKKQAALDAGWKYIEIPYKLEKSLSEATILKMIEETEWGEEVVAPPTLHQKQLEKQRAYNREMYRRMRQSK